MTSHVRVSAHLQPAAAQFIGRVDANSTCRSLTSLCARARLLVDKTRLKNNCVFKFEVISSKTIVFLENEAESSAKVNLYLHLHRQSVLI